MFMPCCILIQNTRRDHGRGYAANRDREIPTVTSGAQVKGSLKEGKEFF